MRLKTEPQVDAKPLHRTNHQSTTSIASHENSRSHSAASNGSAEIPEHLALAARATNDAVRDWDVSTGQLTWPQGLDTLLGYTPGAETADIAFWQKNLHPEDHGRTTGSIRDALVEGENWSGEYRFRRADGNYAHLLERAVIVRDSDGAPVRFVGSLMDITARKQLQDQIVRSQKMEAFGQLAGGVAHDFNNYLTTILGYSDLILDELRMKGPLADHISEIRSAAGRASALTAQLLAFSRKHPLQPAVVEVNSLIAKVDRSLLRLLGANISVECHLHRSKEGVHIKVDPGQMTQIIINLAVNARDAMGKSGRLTLGTGTRRISEHAQPGGCADDPLPAGDYALISITDSGAGMTEEVKAHLFEPFFSTKRDDHGSGLGLATSYGIVRQSGGHICVESELGRGTTVTIYLPKVAAPPAPAYKKPSAKKLPAGSETVLVLEDDIGVRHISVRVLRSLGYDVLEAANGDDAQRLISLDGNKKIDLLLTDMVMPQMSGRDFADWMHTASPHTKVLFISGYMKESLHAGSGCDHDMFFLAKPFDAEQLAGKVREALDCVVA